MVPEEAHAEDAGFLAASLLSLALGVVVFHLLRASRWRSLLSLASALGVVLLIAVEVLPECVEQAGAWALLVATLCAIGPGLWERHDRSHETRRSGLVVVATLALHAASDGLALAAGHDHGGGGAHGLQLAVLLHRIPEGAALFWLLRPRGVSRTVFAFAALAAVTTLGFFGGEMVAEAASSRGVALLQAATGGLLLHVLWHRRSWIPVGRRALSAALIPFGARP